MPEGPEIYILNIALNKANFDVNSYGKHIYIPNLNQDWAFALNGKVNITKDGNLIKKETAWMSGSIKEVNSLEDLIQKNKLGINWIFSLKNDIEELVNKWKTSRRALGTLLLDQSFIAGIGIAWGSEILHYCNLKPEIPAQKQDLSNLTDSILHFQYYSKNLYITFLNEWKGKEIEFINSWFDNLYKIRNMKIYKKGKITKVSGRNWWV